MSSSIIENFVAVLANLSRSPRPYAAIANYLALVTSPPVRPVWAQVLSVGNIIASFALLLASLLTCLVRIKAGTFSLGHIANGRILRPNAAIGWALGCVLYSILAILDLSLTLAGDNEHVVKRGRTFLPGTKYISLWTGAWIFSWSSFGHYVCSRWDPPWQLSYSSPAGQSQIPRAVAGSLNLTFAFVPILVGVSTVAIFSIMEAREIQIITAVSSAVKELRSLDANTTGENFNLVTVLRILEPLAGIQTISEEIVKLLRVGVMVWIVYLLIAIVAQFTFIFLTLSQTRVGEQAMGFWEFWETLKEVIKNESPKTNSRAINYVREQNVLVILSATISIGALSLAPLAIWQYLNATLENLTKLSFTMTTELTASCAVSLAANIVTWKTLAQIRRFATAQRKAQRQPPSDPTASDELRMRKSVRWSSANDNTMDTPHAFEGPLSGVSNFLSNSKPSSKIEVASAKPCLQLSVVSSDIEDSLETPGPKVV